MIRRIEVVVGPFFEPLFEVVPHDSAGVPLLANPRPAPNKGLVLGLDAARQFLDSSAMRLAIVLVARLVGPSITFVRRFC